MLILQAALALATPGQLVLGTPESPRSVRTEWRSDGCALFVTVTNDSPTPVEIDWNRSVIATPDAGSVRLVPGTASRLAASSGMQPLVVAASSHGDEELFRADRLTADDAPGCTLDTPSSVVVNLRLDSGWLVQPIAVVVDEVAARVEMEAADARAAAALETARVVAAERHAAEVAEMRAALADGLARLDGPRQAVLQRPRLDLHVGELCFRAPNGWKHECHATDGANFATAREKLERRMRVCPDEHSKRAVAEMQSWRSARATGDRTVWWSLGFGGVAYIVARTHADAVEQAYRDCVEHLKPEAPA